MSSERNPSAFFTDLCREDPLFDDVLARLFLCRDQEEISSTISFLIHHLHLQSGDTVFDQCCGIGSLAIPLAERGMRVIGVDLCESYIRQAKNQQSTCELYQGDAHSFVPAVPCDAAFNWFTSFGFAADEINGQMLSCAFRALRSGGRFALDFPNIANLLRRFRPADVLRASMPDGEALLLREAVLDFVQGSLNQEWTLILPAGERRVRHSRLRLYLPSQLIAMLEGSGFVEIELFGGAQGEPFHLSSPRCICLARKP